MNTIFFGSTADSVLVLSRLTDVVCVVTQPARPVGRKQILVPTPVEMWAKKQNIAVLSFPHQKDKPWLFENEQTVIDALQPLRADLVLAADFGQKIPSETIRAAKFGGLNIHPSLLPRWRGADPVPWAILAGDQQTGVTVVTLTEKFDEGKIIAQKKYPITAAATSGPLRTKLFEIGAELLTDALPDYLSGKNKGISQHSTRDTRHATLSFPYARRFTRADGFEPWEKIQDPQEAERIERKFRALNPWPGLWTEIRAASSKQRTAMETKKRLKIHSLHLDTRLVLDLVQLEGKKPVPWKQFQNAYLAS